MKSKKVINITIISSLIFFIILSISIFLGLSVIKKDMLKVNGISAEDISLIISKNFSITDDEVKELKNESFHFDDLKTNDANNRLANLISDVDYNQHITNVYVLSFIESEDDKKIATGEAAKNLQLPEGTVLDSMWLLNCRFDKDEKIDYPDHRDDIYRYTKTTTFYKKLYENKESNYCFVSDAWGDFISGFAPLYTDEGTFVGVIGIDFELYQYQSIVKNLTITCVLLMSIIIILLFSIFVLFYFNYMRMSKDKLYLDTLTHFNNRTYYTKFFQRNYNEINKKFLYTIVLMIDIDNFKAINDTYGHEVGDDCLQKIASSILGVWNFDFHNITRYGGEEFVLMFGTNHFEEIDKQLNLILSNVKNVSRGTSSDPMTLSIGVIYTKKNQAFYIDDLVEQADVNLYQAKQNGKDQYIINEYSTNSHK